MLQYEHEKQSSRVGYNNVNINTSKARGFLQNQSINKSMSVREWGGGEREKKGHSRVRYSRFTNHLILRLYPRYSILSYPILAASHPSFALCSVSRAGARPHSSLSLSLSLSLSAICLALLRLRSVEKDRQGSTLSVLYPAAIEAEADRCRVEVWSVCGDEMLAGSVTPLVGWMPVL